MQIDLAFTSITVYGLGVAIAATLYTLVMLKTVHGKADGIVLSLATLIPALIFARIFYCLARYDFVFVEMDALFILRTWEGGFLLWGAIAGVALGTYGYARIAKRSAAKLFDGVAIPSLVAICVLRGFEFFTYEGRGTILDEGSLWSFFPIACMNEYDEWQLAIFVWEAVAALIIAVVVMKHKGRNGSKALLAVMLFAASQAVFESLRMDSCPRIGFVRVSQVLSGIALVASTIGYNWSLRGKRAALWRGGGAVLCCVLIGILEWALDKTPLSLSLCYIMMCVVLIATLLYGLVGKGRHYGFEKKDVSLS